MNKMFFNQFQSVYKIDEYWVVVDFLKNTVYKIKGENLNIFFEHDENYDKLSEMLDDRLNDQEKDTSLYVTVITDFKCNMNCIYCYEQGIVLPESEVNEKNPEKIVRFIEDKWKTGIYKDISINILGGEPLMSHNMEFISTLCEKINQLGANIRYSITTNGLNVVNYIDDILKWKIGNVQITLDGVGNGHNERRRPNDNRIDGFQKISQGIELLLDSGCFVTLRMNIDRNNIDQIKPLADYIINRKWVTKNFDAYIYPITTSGNDKYLIQDSELEIFNMAMDTIGKDIQSVERIFKLDFHGIDYLRCLIDKKIPKIKTKFCGVERNQYVISDNGKMYACWWGIGENEFDIGNLGEDRYEAKEKIDRLKQRSTIKIKRCQRCKFKYLCGGGCAYREWMNKKSTNQGNCAEFDLLFEKYLRSRIKEIEEYVPEMK